MDSKSGKKRRRDDHDQIIVDELCSYQSQLEQGIVSSGADLVPSELQPKLDEFRHCLDLIHEARTQANQTPHEVDPMSGYSLPTHIGRFEIVERLGVGGFSIVFRGIDPVMKREVAIKIPRPELLGSPLLIDRFEREAAAVSQLKHPNIVPVYESDCFEIVPYLVMPYISGKTLAQWRAEQKDVSPRIAAEIVRELSIAVAHAHERGVLHRDLKPGNVLLAARETQPDHEARPVSDELEFLPKLTDFGLAKCAAIGRQDTRTGSMIGTASYMSPEQAEGRSREITARSDVYGLGVILYELLAGQPPFGGANQLQTIQQVLRDDPPPFRQLSIKVPIDLEVICWKCLEKSPAKRYPSADALKNDLQAFLDGEPIRARPISLVARIGKWSRRHPTRATAMAAMLFGMIALFALTFWYNSRLTVLLAKAKADRLIARNNELNARRRAYVSDMRNAKITGDRDNVRQMLKLLERHRPKEGQIDVRDFAWWHMGRDYQGLSRVLGTHDRGAVSVELASDGKLVASGGYDSVIRLWSLPDGRSVGELRGHESGAVEALSFSPDSRRLVSAGEDGTVRYWDVLNLKPLAVRQDHKSRVHDVRFSPCGGIIASAGEDEMIRLWSPENFGSIGFLRGHSGAVLCLTFHPVESVLASGGRDGRIHFWDWMRQIPDRRVKGGSIQLGDIKHWAHSLVFSPEGQFLDVGISNAEVIRYSFEAEANGEEDLSTSNDEPERRKGYGRELNRRKERGIPLELNWPQNGGSIASLGNSEIHVSDRFDVSLPGESLHGHLRAVPSFSVSVDGTSMVSASLDGDIRYWPDFQNYSRINALKDKRTNWKEGVLNYDIQWRESFLAADFQQKEVAVYRMPQAKLERAIPKNNEDVFVLSPSGRLLLVFQLNGRVSCVPLAEGIEPWTLQLPSRNQDFFCEFCVIDQSDTYCAASWNDDVLIFSARTAEILFRLSHRDRVWQVALVQKGNEVPVLISACHDGYLRFWDVGSGKKLAEFQVNVGPTYSVAVSDDRQFIATSGEDHNVRIWNARSMEEVTALPSYEPTGPSRLGFVEGWRGSKILARQNQGLSLWSISDETELLNFPECGPFGQFSISPDRQQLAIPQHGWIRLIDGRPGEIETELNR